PRRPRRVVVCRLDPVAWPVAGEVTGADDSAQAVLADHGQVALTAASHGGETGRDALGGTAGRHGTGHDVTDPKRRELAAVAEEAPGEFPLRDESEHVSAVLGHDEHADVPTRQLVDGEEDEGIRIDGDDITP